jgi:hypothetical protein
MKASRWSASAVMKWSGREPMGAEGRVLIPLLPCNQTSVDCGGPTADDKRAGKSGSAGAFLPVGADQSLISLFFDPLVRVKYFPYFP